MYQSQCWALLSLSEPAGSGMTQNRLAACGHMAAAVLDLGDNMAGQLHVLVTGANSGIGRATAIELARQGHLVFAAARREEALASLAAATPNIQAVSLDVTDADSVRRAWAASRPLADRAKKRALAAS